MTNEGYRFGNVYFVDEPLTAEESKFTQAFLSKYKRQPKLVEMLGHDALQLAQAWKLNPINLGKVGHINVAAGFGPFPEILNYMLPENNHQPVKRMRQTPFNLKFA